MRSKHSITVILFGWFFFTAYIFYDYAVYGANVTAHFLSFTNPFVTIFHVSILIVLIGAHITAYLINERKKLLEKTKRSKVRLKQAAHEWKMTFDSMPYGVLLTDGECNIIQANKYILKLSNLTEHDLLLKKKCYEVICKKDSFPHACPINKADVHNRMEIYEYNDRVNKKVFIETVNPVIDEKGTLGSYIHVLNDITDSREKERKIIRSKDAFFNMLKDLDAAYKETRDVYNDLIITLSNIIDAKSPWTRGHSTETSLYATSIAVEMGLNEEDVETLRTAALLHDIGKIGTYDVILDKPEDLNDAEQTLIRHHTLKGEEILKPIKGLKKILPVIRSHHERFDGKGYPDGLRGERIHLLARILCVADSYDSMTSDRPYRPSCGKRYAITELRKCAAKQFDPEVVETFISILENNDRHTAFD